MYWIYNINWYIYIYIYTGSSNLRCRSLHRIGTQFSYLQFPCTSVSFQIRWSAWCCLSIANRFIFVLLSSRLTTKSPLSLVRYVQAKVRRATTMTMSCKTLCVVRGRQCLSSKIVLCLVSYRIYASWAQSSQPDFYAPLLSSCVLCLAESMRHEHYLHSWIYAPSLSNPPWSTYSHIRTVIVVVPQAGWLELLSCVLRLASFVLRLLISYGYTIVFHL